MNNRRQWITVVLLMVAVMAAVLALAFGIGSALAQDQGGNQAPADPGPRGMGGRFAGHGLAGEVVKVEDNKITIKTLKDGSEKTVLVDDQTKYRKDGKDASLSDVTVGEKIGVRLGKKPAEGQDPTAKAIVIGKPAGTDQRPKPVVGTVKSLNGDTLTVTTPSGDQQVKIPAITPGMRIAVQTNPDGSVRGFIYNPPERPQGQQGDGNAPEPAPAEGSAS